jgi:hypothetical protein
MVHRLYCLGASGFIVTVLRLLRIGTVGTYQKGQGEEGQRGFHLMLRVDAP